MSYAPDLNPFCAGGRVKVVQPDGREADLGIVTSIETSTDFEPVYDVDIMGAEASRRIRGAQTIQFTLDGIVEDGKLMFPPEEPDGGVLVLDLDERIGEWTSEARSLLA